MKAKHNIPCPICDSSRTNKIIDWDRYAIYRCDGCKLLFSNPLPDHKFLNEFYQGFLFNIPDKHVIAKQVNSRKKELARLFEIENEKTTFLDYGGGAGTAYKAARELNLLSYYHDLDKEAEAFAKETHKLSDKFIINDITDKKEFFDYIFSDNVIEHLIAPIPYLEEIRQSLTVGGQAIIKTPQGGNTASYFNPLITINGYFFNALKYNSFWKSFLAYRRRFWHCDPPRHLYSFTEASMRIAARNAGFKDSEIEFHYYHILFKNSILSIFLNFRKYRSLRSFFIRILIVPILFIEVISRLVLFLLLKMKLVSHSGMILKLKKQTA